MYKGLYAQSSEEDQTNEGGAQWMKVSIDVTDNLNSIQGSHMDKE